MKQIKLGIVGLGCRGFGLLKDVILCNSKAEVVAVCDLYEDRTENGRKAVAEKTGREPFASTRHMDIINHPEVEFVVITSSWESHIPIAIAAMEAGKGVAMEVGGAYSVEQCFDLVRCWEKTRVPFMFLENCCYGKIELFVKNMVEKGVFGEIVHCSGGYHHDLREEVADGEKNRHYRLRNYLGRNCENYPTHELGPIAKILGINRGNRMISLTSMASKSAGLRDYIKRTRPESDLVNARFAQGDIVTTVIKCAGGETIVLTLDTTLPRYYSRGFCVRGTRGFYEETTSSVFIDGDDEWTCNKENYEEYYEKYEHPIWEEYRKNGVKGTHDGMDWLEFDRLFDCLLSGREPEIDVYDAAAWMCITALSEKSIALGGTAVDIPDFTGGMWTHR